MLIDSEKVIAEDLATMLSEDGYYIIPASDAAEALAAYDQAQAEGGVDMIIIDPAVNDQEGVLSKQSYQGHSRFEPGLELLDKMLAPKDGKGMMPFVLIYSTLKGLSGVEEAFKFHPYVNQVLWKPVTYRALLKTIDSVLQ